MNRSELKQSSNNRALSVIIPTYNEEKRIGQTLSRLSSFLLTSQLKCEIIVVNDPGDDRTAEVVREFADNASIKIILIETGITLGKGGAIRVGVEKARGDIVLFMDADLPTELSAIIQFYELVNNGADCVFGTRLRSASFMKEPLVRRVLSCGFHVIFKALFGLDYDTQCGVKCARRDVALEIFQHVTVERFAYDVDFVVQAK